MTEEELGKKIYSFQLWLEKLMRESGLPVEGSARDGLKVHGHDVCYMLRQAISGRFHKRFLEDDFSLVGNWLDDNWNALQEPPKPKKSIFKDAMLFDPQIVFTRDQEGAFIQAIANGAPQPARRRAEANLRGIIEG